MNGKASLKFSIITVVYNGEQFIEETINSVLSQSYQNIEYIIIDGASTDKSVEIIEKYRDKLYYYISERDSGMYDAINKGIAKATGDYILILNSDDYLNGSQIIEQINNKIAKAKYDFFYCNILRKKEDVYREIKLKKYTLQQLLCSEHCTFIPHPSFFISMHFIKKQNLKYNLQFKYASDFEYILNTIDKSQENYCHLPIFSTVFREHPNSITSSGKINSERLQILENWGLYKMSFIKRMFLYYKNWIAYKLIN